MGHTLRRLLVGIALAQASFAAIGQTDTSSPYVPSPPLVVDRMLALAGVTAKDVVIDLGSGDGRIPIAAAKQYGARAIGVEYDPKLVKLSRENASAAGVADQVRFVEGDLFKVDLSDATVVTVYLLPDVNRMLRDKLLAELKPGARLVAHDFDMESWRPDRTERFHAPQKHDGRGGESRIMLWVIPATVRGDWQLESGVLPEGKGALKIAQNFQAIEGDATVGGARVALGSPRLQGTEIRFAVPAAGRPLQFVGGIDGDAMAGVVRDGSREWPWRARRVP